MKRGPVKKLIDGVAVTIDRCGLWYVEVDNDKNHFPPGVISHGVYRYQAIRDAELKIQYLLRRSHETGQSVRELCHLPFRFGEWLEGLEGEEDHQLE